MIASLAPATGERLGEVRVATQDAVRAAFDRARRAQRAWGAVPVEERAERLLRLRDAFLDRAEEIVEIVSRECGKPRQDVLGEITAVVDLATYYCKNAARILAPREIRHHSLKHKASSARCVPRGVVAVLSPWNFPFAIPMNDVIAALVAGNAVIVKPSDVTPLTMDKCREIFAGTGLPEDLFEVVHGGADVGQWVVESGVRKVVFTGGVASGRKVAATCGANLVPCVMELGGKAPLVACADCDVERTARAIVFGGFFNAGQACVSVERVYAHVSIHDRLVERVRELVGKLAIGNPDAACVDIGAVTFERQVEVAERLIADAVENGARVVAGGRRLPGAGRFFEPTILVRCKPTMAVMREEIFGPIVAFQTVTSDDEAIALANDSDLGLNAYVFTSDRDNGLRLAERIDAGSVVVNDVIVNYGASEAPFGGIKNSGFGKVHGDDALRAMCDERVTMVSRIPETSSEPFWFPYSDRLFDWHLRLIRALYRRGSPIDRLRKLL